MGIDVCGAVYVVICMVWDVLYGVICVVCVWCGADGVSKCLLKNANI